jgi:hypothetical protein
VVGNVLEMNKDGKRIAQYCAHPMHVPVGDVLLTQKLWLECDEPGFLSIANVHWRRSGQSVWRRHLHARRAARIRWGWKFCGNCATEHRPGFRHRKGEQLALDKREMEWIVRAAASTATTITVPVWITPSTPTTTGIRSITI